MKKLYNYPMKKYVSSISLILAIGLLCSCNSANTATEFLLDTVVTITADCDEETLSGAFALCREYDKLFSAKDDGSEISALNRGETKEVSKDTAELIEKATEYSALSGGRFDLTIYPLTVLWDFKNEIVPSKDEIAAALNSVDYESVKVEGTRVITGGKKIDLGAIAKGYITDKVLEYLKENGAKNGIINLGGNVYVFGDKEYNIGIKKPYSEENAAVLKLKNKTASTSGVYERYFEKDNIKYHHIIDPKTGYPAKSDLLSATVICDNSAMADAFSTICILKGKEEALDFIENTKGAEAIFIDETYKLSFTKGIKQEGEFLILR